ncbi:Crp/Fnr family transcriptional regulator [Sulfuriferula plumbiphila]|uniref:Crp/Fnr family transcriptional regulator n=1 Tax=Sulfuriferula plumbiphila TaxID=171865 RepID=A0A512LC19_9PROT|nr:Crp/Fnr family transcriptional regulator [Sulfuriferula plumbiphila]BBP03896.1 Crp/Fnr family transcriptional regulator [Sulfuriferula plumbiphila]GEP31681.1 Crp/Fnr family transcriptional regulator [Sulfuriferula plumbiphila]
MSELRDPQQNYILRALSPPEFERIAPHLELVSMSCAEVLYEVNEKLQFAYFPTTATASLLCGLEDGASVEVAVVGNEGMLGVSVFMGGDAALTQATIHTAGYGYRIPAKSLREALGRSGGRRAGTLQQLLLRYAQTLIMQMAQTTACNRRHSVEQQLCRWLLLNFDRMHSSSLAMTQELISNMLGVRRESITEAARKLQQAGIISYHRGHIEVTNRPELETHVCECYGILKKESERLVTDLLAA